MQINVFRFWYHASVTPLTVFAPSLEAAQKLQHRWVTTHLVSSPAMLIKTELCVPAWLDDRPQWRGAVELCEVGVGHWQDRGLVMHNVARDMKLRRSERHDPERLFPTKDALFSLSTISGIAPAPFAIASDNRFIVLRFEHVPAFRAQYSYTSCLYSA